MVNDLDGFIGDLGLWDRVESEMPDVWIALDFVPWIDARNRDVHDHRALEFARIFMQVGIDDLSS